MSRPVRFGVLGCGGIARRKMLPALRDHPDTEIAAVASRDPARAEEFAAEFGGAPVTGYRELLARDDVDAVYVAVPTGLHAEWALAGLAAGRHLLVEKLLTPSAAETAELFASAGRHGLVLRENVMFLHHGQHAAVRSAVAGGAVGEPRGFDGVFRVPPFPPGNVRYVPELGGGALLDLAVYPLRAAMYHLGDDLTVVGAVLHEDDGLDVSATALLVSAAGIPVTVGIGFRHAYESRYALWGTGGRLTLDRAFTPPPDHRPRARLSGSDGERDLDLPPEDQFLTALGAFVAEVRSGVPTRPGDAASRASLRTVELIEDIRRLAHRIPGGTNLV